MSNVVTENTRIVSIDPVINPQDLHAELPISATTAELVAHTRHEIHEILHGRDDRLVVVAGPCSIHDPASAIDYAERLLKLKQQYADDLLVVMRVYFEKPRTTVGWKGLINDPNIDESFDINLGLRKARQLLMDLNGMGVPAGTEFLDIITPQYLADLISWGAIGARTTESQVHREMTSGLSCPVGLKNGTNGNLDIAIDAIRAAAKPHHFLSLTKDGETAIYNTSGNEDCHIILRGGQEPNYDAASVEGACKAIAKVGLRPQVMVDFSHANSRKNHDNQPLVCQDVATQIANGEQRINGVMIESHLVAGRQDVVDINTLVYGQSITDACVNMETTSAMLAELSAAVQKRRNA